MNEKHNRKLTPLSRNLRKQMTEEESKLWYTFFKNIPQTVNRQKVIGRYIVDFYCADSKLVIELDGEQHYVGEGKLKDEKRDAYLNSLGIKVLRYSNYELKKHYKDVCEDIWHHIITRGTWDFKE
ncbi:MAG: endonuclease domain-containing protein [Clostridiales bacterium]|nr:endonuclease domain-containing protein [Clostridiales bacterium]